MFKVDGAEYTFLTWFAGILKKDFINILLTAKSEKEVAKKAKEAEDKGSPEWIAFIEEHFESAEMYEAGMTKECAKKILDAIDDNRAGKKFIPGGPNVILTKKTKPGFWVGIDEKFLVKIIQGEKQSEYIELDANAVVYGLYRIWEPDSKRLMPMKDGTLNCVAQRVIEHFEKAKKGYGFTSTQDVAELEKILKRPIKLLDITHGTIFNSGKYRTAIWLIELGLGEGETLEEIQSISQFVLEDGRTFRTWIKHTDIIKACKELFEDAVDWQFREGIINKERKRKSLESLKIVELAEQVFGANHVGGKLANEINNWHPTPASVHENIKQSCVEHGHEGRWNAPNYQVEDVICIDMKECYPASMRGQGECSPWFKQFGHPTHHLVRVAVEGELPPDDITGFAQ
ncbi:hypothetical protein C1646_776557, partial [Rhizophagus diaphanus]